MSLDVAIVGAGPAGAALAGLLAARGVKVLLLDRARFPRGKPCGECLNPGAVAALRRLGLWGAVEPLGAPAIRGWRVIAAGGREHDLPYPGGLSGCAADRRRLDHALLRWAVARGAELAEGVRVTDLLLRNGRVVGLQGAGRPTNGGHVYANFVVGADGLRSVVLRRLGLLAPAKTAPRVAFTAHWAGLENLSDRGELHLYGQAVCGIAPVGPAEANVVLVLPAGAARRTPNQGALLARWPGLRERFAHARPAGPLLATGPFDQPARAVTAPGALLAGDAAGYFDPLTGQGIYRALRSAELAAPAIIAALEGREADGLATYAQRMAAEFAPAVRRQRLIDQVVRRPALLTPGLGLLTLCPPAVRHLMGLVGDCYSPKE
jgi:menaquinone-9 beta-reductase